MHYILALGEIKPLNQEMVGLKALNLGLASRTQKTPLGFVITTLGFRHFIEKTKIKPKISELLLTLNDSNLQKVANQIQELIMDAKIPEDLESEIIDSYHALSISKELTAHELLTAKPDEVKTVILRSSYTKKIGHESFKKIHLKNVKEEKNLIQAVKVMFATQYLAKNLKARKETDTTLEPILSVIVQTQVEAEKSMQAYTYDPENNNFFEVYIKALIGEDKGFEDPENSPDTYILDKQTLDVKVVNINSQKNVYKNGKASLLDNPKKQKLHENEIKKAGKIAKETAETLRKDQIIELLAEDKEFYLVNSTDTVAFIKSEVVDSTAESPGLEVYEAKETEAIDEKKLNLETYDNTSDASSDIEVYKEQDAEPMQSQIFKSDDNVVVEEIIETRQPHVDMQAKAEDGDISYDEEDDLKEEFDKEEVKVYEDEYVDLSKKKILPKPRINSKEDSNDDDRVAYYEKEVEEPEDNNDEDSDEDKPKKREEESDDFIFSNLKTY